MVLYATPCSLFPSAPTGARYSAGLVRHRNGRGGLRLAEDLDSQIRDSPIRDEWC